MFREATKSSDEDEVELKERGQTLSHLQTLHITASSSSQEEDERRRRRGGGEVKEIEQKRIGQKK